MSAPVTRSLPYDPATVKFDPLLRRLNLANTRRRWPELLDQAETQGWSCREFLGVLITEEIAHRQQTRIQRSVRQAHFPFLKTVDEFDFSLQSSLRLPFLGSYLGPELVSGGRSLILQGKSGRGKTHLVIAIAYRAIQNGFTARFVTAASLIETLSVATRLGRLHEALANYLQPHVLVVDEVGYLSYGPDAANVLFHVVNERHLRRRPMLFTTNKPPLTAWGDVLHDHDLAEAIVDRVLERGRLLLLDGPSYRTQHLDLPDAGAHDAMPLFARLASYWCAIQAQLFPVFPVIEEELGPLGERYQCFITVLEFVRVEQFLPYFHCLRGRPRQDRAALARAFIAKAVFQLATTRALLERLAHDRPLRRLCGYDSVRALPSEATFSRAFAEFAESALPSRLHEALIKNTMQDHLVGHVSRDSTAIEVREQPVPKPKPAAKPKRKRGRPRKGEQRPPQEPRRLELQLHLSLPQMLDDLPQACAVGSKRNAKGHQQSWIGYKLHIDAADGGIPLSCILTSASLHDSQVAIPLATMTAQRVTNLYDLMDSAYDAAEIRAHSQWLGHVPIVDLNPRRDAELKRQLKREAQARRNAGHVPAEQVRYRERSTVERVNSRLKDEFGARQVRVRGHAKVLCHLLFGIVALTVDQLLRLVN